MVIPRFNRALSTCFSREAMLGVRAIWSRATVAPKPRSRPQTRLSNQNAERPVHTVYKAVSSPFNTLRYKLAASIRQYSNDSVHVPAKSIEGFGGPTDTHHYSDDVESACRKGILLRDAGDTDGALLNFTKAIELSNDMSYRAYSLRADLNQTLGNHNEALFDYTRVLKYLPTHVPTLTSQASVHKRMGDYEKAKAQFEFILTFEGMYAPAWLGKAECHAQLGEHDLAVTAFNKALEFKDRWIPAASVYEALGDSLMMTNKVAEAVTAYRTSLGLSASSASCWGAFGVALYITRNFPEATDAFTQAMNLGGSPKFELLAKRASCYLHFGNLNKAMADCIAALADAPDFYKVRLIKAQIHHQLEQYEEAVVDYSAFIKEADQKLSSSARDSTEAMSEHWTQLADMYARRAECYVELWAIEVARSGRADPAVIMQSIVMDETPPSHTQTIARFEEVGTALSIIGSTKEASFLKLAFDDLVSARKLTIAQPDIANIITIIREILNYAPSSSPKSKAKVINSNKQL